MRRVPGATLPAAAKRWSTVARAAVGAGDGVIERAPHAVGALTARRQDAPLVAQSADTGVTIDAITGHAASATNSPLLDAPKR